MWTNVEISGDVESADGGTVGVAVLTVPHVDMAGAHAKLRPIGPGAFVVEV